MDDWAKVFELLGVDPERVRQLAAEAVRDQLAEAKRRAAQEKLRATAAPSVAEWQPGNPLCRVKVARKGVCGKDMPCPYHSHSRGDHQHHYVTTDPSLADMSEEELRTLIKQGGW